MITKPLSQADLQALEYANKVLNDHLETVNLVSNESEKILATFTPLLASYIDGIASLRKNLGDEVVHIMRSTRELKVITSGVQELISFSQAVKKLDEILTPELLEKLSRLVK